MFHILRFSFLKETVRALNVVGPPSQVDSWGLVWNISKPHIFPWRNHMQLSSSTPLVARSSILLRLLQTRILIMY